MIMPKLTAENIEKIMKEELAKVAFRIQRAARNNAPIDTGRLKGSIDVVFEDNGKKAIIGTNVKYAQAVEFGAKAHTIRPKNKKALFWKGAKHPVKSVNHPGFRGRFYLTRAFQEHKDSLAENIIKRLQQS